MQIAAAPPGKYAIRYQLGMLWVAHNVMAVTLCTINAAGTRAAPGRNRAAKYPMSTTAGKVMHVPSGS